MSDYKLNAEKRDLKGKNKVDKLRAENLIPGVVYTKGGESIPVVAIEKELVKIIGEAGTSNLIELNIDGSKQMGLFKEIQNHPFKNQVLHFDFYGVNMNETLRLSIPVVLENKDNVRVQPSILLQLLDEVEVECLPAHLPSEAVADVADMQIGDVLTVADTDVYKDENIKVLTNIEEPIASLSEPREEVIEEDTEGEEGIDAADVPTVDETKSEE